MSQNLTGSVSLGTTPEFYLKVAHDDDSLAFGGIQKINLNVLDFYIHRNTGNTDEVNFNLRQTGPEAVARGTGLVEAVGLFIEAPSAISYVFEQNAEYDYTIDKVTHQLDAGTFYTSFFIDGVQVGGFYELESSSTEITSTASSPNQVNTGQRVTIVGAEPSGDAARLGATVKITRT